MVSLKNETRAAITTAMVAALATTIFAGCKTTTPSTPDVSSVSSSTSSSSSSSADSIPEGSTPVGSADDSNSIKFKYWYENNKSSETTGISGTATGDTLFGSDSLMIYEDADGGRYVGSDFRHISVTEEDSISSTDAVLLRDADDYKIYLMDADVVLKEDFTMPSFEELQAADLAEGTAQVDSNTTSAILYVNGILAGEIESPTKLNVSDIFSVAANIGAIDFKNNIAVISFGTAVDVITATFTPQSDSSLIVTYSTNDTSITIPAQSATYNFSNSSTESNYLSLDLEYIEKTLGYHIISSTNAEGTLELNVITDTKDELKEGNAIAPEDAESHITNVDTSEVPVEPIEPTTTSEPVESQPTESKPQSTSSTSSTTTTTSTPTESKPADTSTTTSTTTSTPSSSGTLTAAAAAAIADYTKAADPNKTAATTPNTINSLNTPGHVTRATDNQTRTPVTVNGEKYWVDDNGVYYDSYGFAQETYNIGRTAEDINEAIREAEREQAAGIPIGANATQEELDAFLHCRD